MNLSIPFLLNMVGTGGKKPTRGPHGLRPNVLQAQAQAIGRTIIQTCTDWDSYERKYKNQVTSLKNTRGIEVGVFGDSELPEHRQWVENTCRETGIEPHLPLWGEEAEDLYREFINSGFEAVLVDLRDDLFSIDHLGRRLDLELLHYLKRKDIHLTGEGGEYHTLALDGPIFETRLEISKSEITRNGDRLQYDILAAKPAD